jgi:hypothetical protein
VTRDCLPENVRPPEIRVASPPSRLVPSCNSEFRPRIGDRLNARAGEGLSQERLSLRYEPPASFRKRSKDTRTCLPAAAFSAVRQAYVLLVRRPWGWWPESWAPFFCIRLGASPRRPHSDMHPCYALRQRYTMPCCPQAATPAGARTVWGYENDAIVKNDAIVRGYRLEAPRRPAPHSVYATRHAMPLPS